MVLTAEQIVIGTNNLSQYVKKAELGIEVEDKEVTNYASAGWKERIGGLKDGSLDIDFIQDFSAAGLDAIMWAKLGTVTTFAVRATDAATSTSTSNPGYTGNLLVKEWSPLQGSVGDEATVGVSYPTSGAVTRTTS